jgi:glycerophosphoryl diester phosphodiesterase
MFDREPAVDTEFPAGRDGRAATNTSPHNVRLYGRNLLAVSARPLVIAHRGASGYRPEHTAAAYRLAIRQGADAVEPDLVPTRDGVLVVRHENEISGTTDIADHPQFADRRTTKTIDGSVQSGWFTEDFTWAELSTLRARERLPELRPGNAGFDGREGIIRLLDLLQLLEAADRPVLMVAELKHATYFESIGLPLEEPFAGEIAGWARPDNLVVESFEQTVLGKVQELDVPGRVVFLADATGAPADQVAKRGWGARPFADYLTDAGLAGLAGEVDGVSVDKALLLAKDDRGNVTGSTDLAHRARAAGLETYAWTLRAENQFLARTFRRGRRPRDFGHWQREFDVVMRSGVDGVFADQPDLALRVRAAL